MSNENTIQNTSSAPKVVTSLLDEMKDEREYESLIEIQQNKNIRIDTRKAIQEFMKEISDITKRPNICYIANINTKIPLAISIDESDHIPFSEMINSIPRDIKEIDVILVTPGGSAQQVAKFVDKLRTRFAKVNFILPYLAMSAGTIFALSGNTLYMGPDSYLGPIDPQVLNSNGVFVPAQSILTVIDDIKKKGEKAIKNGENIPWTDLQILRQIDKSNIGVALNASKYATELVTEYLRKYKFSDWNTHNSSGTEVTLEEKQNRAEKVAKIFCDHSKWRSHSRGITRDEIINECKLKVKKFEDTKGLHRVMRRFWAQLYFLFEGSRMSKLFISEKYCIIRQN